MDWGFESMDDQDKQGIRNYVGLKFNVELTENQWEVLFDEVDNREPDELMSDVIDQVVPNIKDYEDEPAFLDELKKAIESGDTTGFLKRNFDYNSDGESPR
jgi:hypothetical protein